MIVSNTGTKRGTVRLYAADASTGQTTGTVYLTDAHPVRAGAWIQLATNLLTLAPGHFRRVTFAVHVPTNAPPGEWVGGVVAETTQKAQSGRTNRKAGVQIKVRNQTIIAVQVNVPGKKTAAFEVGRVKTGGQRGFQQLIVHLSNTGNVLRKPSGRAEVVQNGHLVQTLPFVMDTFLPQTSIDYPILLKRALGPGAYVARVALTYPNAAGHNEMNSATVPFTVSKTAVKQVFTSAAPTKQPAGPAAVASSNNSTPWVWIAVAALGGLALLALLAWWLLHRRGGTRPEYVPTVVMPLPPLPPLRGEAAVPIEREEPAAPAPHPPASSMEFAPSAYGITRDEPVLTGSTAGLCEGHHLWEVAYDRGELGRDGAWRFPHRCRECGLELMATDTADAAAQALAPAPRR